MLLAFGVGVGASWIVLLDTLPRAIWPAQAKIAAEQAGVLGWQCWKLSCFDSLCCHD